MEFILQINPGHDTALSSGVKRVADDFVFEDYTQRIAMSVVFCLVTIVGLVGNGLVILSVFLSRKLRSPTNCFVVNLAFADLFTCTIIPFLVVALLAKDGWPLEEWVCAVTGAVVTICPGTGAITLVPIAHSRWYLISQSPTKFRSLYTTRTIALMVLFSWLYTSVLALVPHFAGFAKLGYSEKYKTCVQDTSWSNSDYYSLLAAVAVIVPVFAALLIIYLRIFIYVRRHNKMIKRSLSREPLRSASPTERAGCADDNLNQNAGDNGSSNQMATGVPNACEEVGQPGPTSSSVELQCECHVNPSYAQSGDEGIPPDENDTPAPRNQVCSSHPSPDGEETVIALESPKREAVDDQGADHAGVVLDLPPSKMPRSRQERTSDIRPKHPKVCSHQVDVTKRLAMVVVAYFVCLLPFGVCCLVSFSDPAVPWATMLIISNSCINPFIYATTMPTFRQVMSAIVRCRCADVPQPVGFIRKCYRS
ncbi:5-hydroxytryptamine receptor 1B-like [Diadema antillarum]|uniref:5-hydroxytryptamine receptor 1B-like n=1 Tax=Diadema antillarum TaxID=105358 RepID=UPI003A8854B6